MPLLVEGLCPQLTTDLIRQCKSVGIHTVAEFVSSNIEDLSKKSKITYKDLVNIRHNLLSNYGCFPQRADSLYNILLETMLIISTGNKRINTHLKGGIYAGEVTEVFGSPGSGKTQFCLSVCASLVSESENRVLYLDSNANFSARRLEQILSSRCDDKQEAIESLHKISVVNIRDIYHMFDILESVECELRNQKNTSFGNLKLIVIDSVTCLLSPCFGGKYFDGPSLMGSLARLFKVISCEHMISIMITNNTVQSENWCVKAGLGPNWKYVPSVSVCIKKGNDSKVRILQTMKSCRNGLHNETTFFISEVGLSD